MKRVAVVGGGVSGLISTKELLSSGMRVTLLESRYFLGGAWKGEKESFAKEMKPSMWERLKPNLSKITCSFPDHPWPEETDYFPSLPHFARYIDSYVEKFIQGNEYCDIKLGAQVQQVSRNTDTGLFRVKWISSNTSFEDIFDAIIVSTGYFSKPVLPKCLQSKEIPDRIIHSSQYQDILPFDNQKVAVIGGAFSAHELSAEIATVARSVTNITGGKPVYVLPRYLPDVNGKFLPNDLVFYYRHDNASFKVLNILDEEESCRRHGYVQGLLGERRVKFLESCGLLNNLNSSEPPFVSISDDYLCYLQNKRIRHKPRRLTGVEYENDKVTVILDDGTRETGFDKIVCCTGYKPDLSFLHKDILTTLEYDSEDTFLPVTTVMDVYHPDVPGLGFVGMYRGPYFATKYLQIRLFIERFLNEKKIFEGIEEYFKLDESRLIRRTKPRAQFPRFDYVGSCDFVAERLGLLAPESYLTRGNICIPHYYTGDEIYTSQGKKLVDEGLTTTKFHARVFFDGLIGEWKFKREIEDRQTSTVSSAVGTATYNFEINGKERFLRYTETGMLNSKGVTFEFSKKYDYILGDNNIEIYFVEKNERGGLFVSLEFEQTSKNIWVTKSTSHLCIKDLYKNICSYRMDGLSIAEFDMEYVVNGPKKDYISRTFYS